MQHRSTTSLCNAVIIMLAALTQTACSNSDSLPGSRDVRELVVDPDVSFTVKSATLGKEEIEPAPDSAIRNFRTLGCDKDGEKPGVVRCRFSLELYDPFFEEDPGMAFSGSGRFARRGGYWRALQDDYELTRLTAPRPAAAAKTG